MGSSCYAEEEGNPCFLRMQRFLVFFEEGAAFFTKGNAFVEEVLKKKKYFVEQEGKSASFFEKRRKASSPKEFRFTHLW